MLYKDPDNTLFTAISDGFSNPNVANKDEIIQEYNWTSDNFIKQNMSASKKTLLKKDTIEKTEKAVSIHKGHRMRVRKRYMDYGLESFTEYQVLEFILFHSIPQGDTNPLAHKLIDKFGSLEQVLRADNKTLMEVPGIKEVSAALITLFRDVSKYINVNNVKGESLPTTEAVGEFCCRYFSNNVVEEAILIVLDSKRRVVAVEVVSKGDETQTAFSPRTVMKLALAHHGCNVIAAHNHPDGNPMPSNQDVYNTNKLIPALREFDVFMIDHIVCSGDKYISMFEKGYITV